MADPTDLAMLTAQKLVIKELKLDSLPVDPFKIARDRGIIVEPMAKDSRGVSGMLLRAGNNFAIAYATYTGSEGFEHFSVGHELGHYILPGHVDAVLPSGMRAHESRSGFVSDNRFELEADHFSAGLLMPAPLFRIELSKAGDGLDAIGRLASICKTSLTATAVRYKQLTDDPVAIIQSSGGRIEFCLLSDKMKELRLERWLQKGDALPRNSATFRLNHDPQKIEHREKMDGRSDTSEWFSDRHDRELFEEAIGLGRYGRTLTILTVTEEIKDDDESDGDSELEDSWAPKFRR
jgi:hypothetical protein